MPRRQNGRRWLVRNACRLYPATPAFGANVRCPNVCSNPAARLVRYTAKTYSAYVYAIVETPTFVADAGELWSEEERGTFCAWIAANPAVGDVIPGSGGCRKVRWTRAGTGKRGGGRVIYFTRLASGEIWLLVIYAKSVRGSIPASILKAIREAIEHD